MIINGNNIEELKKFNDNYFDSIVTDPPYEIGFMGKSWDASGIANNPEMWAECLRVLKPGGYLLSFSATRTYHRMAVAIEDAGFEVRDMIEWVYGSGFPKSLNIGKAVDKRKGYKEFGNDFAYKLQDFINNGRKAKGLTYKELNRLFGFPDNSGMAGHWCGDRTQPVVPRLCYWERIKKELGLTDEFDNFISEVEREVIGKGEAGFLEKNGVFELDNKGYGSFDLTKGTSEWEGWGTALKPAHEPICMARKPLAEKTVAENVLKYGTGGINIDESRVETSDLIQCQTGHKGQPFESREHKFTPREYQTTGRFPANLIHDNSEEVRECFPNESERFFKSIIYQAKASKSERGVGNIHPTVKPVALMEYLIKMVTPKGGIVLDPFMGSGSTGVACVLNDFEFVGIDLDKDYCEIARARIEGVKETQTKMF